MTLSQRTLDPFRGMRLSSILTIFGGLLLCGFSVYRAVDVSTLATSATATVALDAQQSDSQPSDKTQ